MNFDNFKRITMATARLLTIMMHNLHNYYKHNLLETNRYYSILNTLINSNICNYSQSILMFHDKHYMF